MENINKILEKEKSFFHSKGKDLEDMTLSEIKDYVKHLESFKKEYYELLLKIKNTFSGV